MLQTQGDGYQAGQGRTTLLLQVSAPQPSQVLLYSKGNDTTVISLYSLKEPLLLCKCSAVLEHWTSQAELNCTDQR